MQGQSGCAPVCKRKDLVSRLLSGSSVINSNGNREAWHGKEFAMDLTCVA